MFARDFLNNDIISITPNSDVVDAHNLMYKYKVSHLPVVQDDILYLGLISDDDISYAVRHNEAKTVSEFSLFDDKILHSQHILEAFELVNRSNLSLLPVVDERNSYLGCITLPALVSFFKNIVAFQAQGAIIEITVAISDYSATQITQIIESYGARVLSMYVTTLEDLNQFDVVIKVNTVEITAIMKTLDRYGYVAHGYLMDGSEVNNVYNNRIDSFMRYLNV